jgi:predicted DCC family thiol-disulfide oxidoreductase YuxK
MNGDEHGSRSLRVGERPSGDHRLLVLYDADCGTCSHSARLLRRLDQGRRLRLLPLRAAGEVIGAPTVDVLLDAMHVRDRHGRWTVGAAAWIRIADEVPLLRPMAIGARAPMIGRLVDWAYARAAGNRRRLSRLLGHDACPILPRTP